MSKIRSTPSSEEVSSSSGTSSLSSDEEIDARDLKPIKDYLSDRKELAHQLFKSVKAEKIQMMLPQSLKKMDFEQLEKWCANELSGMSKRRILCVLNGKPMLESSDTSESDDSGPSLEIISDTEEWFTDEDVSKKEEGSKVFKGKVKKERIKQKGKPQLHKRNDNKSVQKKVSDATYKNVQVKMENDIGKNKEKEGDSLLDLLELEMRARAIRALIRKEEDIIPNASKSVQSNDTSHGSTAAKTEQDELKEKENCRRQLERIISAQQNNTVEDEDVVLVVQPTPTIELLSSDSEGEPHSGVRVNQKLQNERIIETKDNIDPIQNVDLNNSHNSNSIENLKEDKTVGSIAKVDTTHKEVNIIHKTETSKRIHSNNKSYKDNQSKSNSKRRKTKKKTHIKEQSKSTSLEVDTRCINLCNINQNEKTANNGDGSIPNMKLNESGHENIVKSKISRDNLSLNKQITTDVLSTLDKPILDEEKSIDLDEIIDLDDYCDDMDDIENNENDKDKEVVEGKICKPQTEINSSEKSNETETWASRYYQTDDVQSVIKESKIQSEIRKRLRERQRLSKLNTSPNKNLPSSPVVEITNNKAKDKSPMGLVDEYLALKHTAAIGLNILNSNNSSSIITDNATHTDIYVEVNRLIENNYVSGICVKNQTVDKEINLSDNVNVDNLANKTTNEEVVDTIDETNSG